MYFPWVGMLEQIKHADVFVHYDDVQFARGFFNRVQIKTRTGTSWLTVPLAGQKRGQLINEVQIDNRADWKRSHIDQLKQAYEGAPFKREMLDVVDAVFCAQHRTLADLAQTSMGALVNYFAPIGADKSFMASSALGIPGSGTQRLIDICIALRATSYLTGHGAKHYLEHQAFEAEGISVSYMAYGCKPYTQMHGEFTPYVSALDLIANRGRDGIAEINGRPEPWREFLHKSTQITTSL